ncbi:MAG: hypothetical protein ABJF50_24955, partial [Paracoccaceae bacterium]
MATTTFFVTIQASATKAIETIRVDAKTGLFTLQHRTVDIVVPSFVFWQDNWKWSAPSITVFPLASGGY